MDKIEINENEQAYGFISLCFFYLLVLFNGIWAGRKSKSTEKNPDSEDLILAGRNVKLGLGVFSMIATWVGGGYINGSAERIYTGGLLMCQAPFCYSASLLIGGRFFAKRMREYGYVTMLDLFQKVYKDGVGSLLFIPIIISEIFWTAAIFGALEGTLDVIGIPHPTVAVCVSLFIPMFYTMFGGMYAVAYTDVNQMVLIFAGLWIAFIKIIYHEDVDYNEVTLDSTGEEFADTIDKKELKYVEDFIVFILGGVPWQSYFQRVLSSSSGRHAVFLSYIAGVGSFLIVVPSLLIGYVAKYADWERTPYRKKISEEDITNILPLSIKYLCTPPLSYICLGAIASAILCSADSSMLSSSSMFARNIYKTVFKPTATEREILYMMRISIVVTCICAVCITRGIKSVYEMWIFSGDLTYVLIFPHLFCAVYHPWVNAYGSVLALTVGSFIRITGGERILKIPALIRYPGYDEKKNEQLFPFKTLAMLMTLGCLFGGTKLSQIIFKKRKLLSTKYDYLKCFEKRMSVVSVGSLRQERRMTKYNHMKKVKSQSVTSVKSVLSNESENKTMDGLKSVAQDFINLPGINTIPSIYNIIRKSFVGDMNGGTTSGSLEHKTKEDIPIIVTPSKRQSKDLNAIDSSVDLVQFSNMRKERKSYDIRFSALSINENVGKTAETERNQETKLSTIKSPGGRPKSIVFTHEIPAKVDEIDESPIEICVTEPSMTTHKKYSL